MKKLGPTENIGSTFSNRNARPLGEVVGEIENIGSEAAPSKPRASDEFANALRSSALDVTISTITSALRIPRNTIVDQEFTGGDYTTYASLANAYQRAEFIASWLRAELLAAAERADADMVSGGRA